MVEWKTTELPQPMAFQIDDWTLRLDAQDCIHSRRSTRKTKKNDGNGKIKKIPLPAFGREEVPFEALRV